jgi:hypothetical protein
MKITCQLLNNGQHILLGPKTRAGWRPWRAARRVLLSSPQTAMYTAGAAAARGGWGWATRKTLGCPSELRGRCWLGLADNARHVVHRILNPRCLTQSTSYDVAKIVYPPATSSDAFRTLILESIDILRRGVQYMPGHSCRSTGAGRWRRITRQHTVWRWSAASPGISPRIPLR